MLRTHIRTLALMLMLATPVVSHGTTEDFFDFMLHGADDVEEAKKRIQDINCVTERGKTMLYLAILNKKFKITRVNGAMMQGA